MISCLLAIIYLAFISLGLPDSLLGAAWPVMHTDLGVGLPLAGVVSMIIAGGTILSSLFSDRLTRRFGAGAVTACSVGLTAVALAGFAFSGSFWMICLWAIPYGLGAGAVDAALNNFVALHYAARHMSWLHCFWGLGASVGPYIMGACLAGRSGWHGGYGVISGIQIVLVVLLAFSLPLWKKVAGRETAGESHSEPLSLGQIVTIPGVLAVLLAFFGYCALETTAGLWASSYLVSARGLSAEMAARYAALFYLGITAGRFINGFVAEKAGDRRLIRIGIGVAVIGIGLVALPVGGSLTALIGLIVIGLGCAPIYPSVIHATPANFGADRSQAIIGVQMASAYAGSTFMPPLFGWLSKYLTLSVYPLYLLVFAVLMLVMTERLNRITARRA